MKLLTLATCTISRLSTGRIPVKIDIETPMSNPFKDLFLTWHKLDYIHDYIYVECKRKCTFYIQPVLLNYFEKQ